MATSTQIYVESYEPLCLSHYISRNWQVAVLGAANLPATVAELGQRKQPCVLDRARSRRGRLTYVTQNPIPEASEGNDR